MLTGRKLSKTHFRLDRVKRIWYLSPMRAAKVQASLRIRAVSPEPSLLAHTSSESRGTLRQKTISLAPLNGWACAVEICHEGMFKDTNSLDGAQLAWVDRGPPQQNQGKLTALVLYDILLNCIETHLHFIVWQTFSLIYFSLI